MSNSQPTAPGFVYPPTNQAPPGYAPIQQQPGQQPQPAYPGYPPTQQSVGYPPYQQQQQQQQPFPNPMLPNAGYNQPQNIQWMTGNFQTYLAGATSLSVKQKVELLEILVGWETGNKYSVKDQAGNQLFYVGEETGFLSRLCCGRIRPFTLAVKDNRGQSVLEFSRGLDIGAYFCNCCLRDEVKVRATNGQFLGSVGEECSCCACTPSFSIKDPSGNVVLRIEGPMCPYSCFGQDLVFTITDLGGNQLGSIRKVWGGVMREMFTDADTFTIAFPQSIDPSIKAVLLGALFMIDFHYFENSGNECGR